MGTLSDAEKDAMAADGQRYDVAYREHGPTLEPHFCRQWDGDVGCYGANPNHGMTFAEAVNEIARWHEERAKMWAEMTPMTARSLGII